MLKLNEFQAIFNPRFESYLEGVVQNVIRMSRNDYLRPYFEHILSYARSGKRVRPYGIYVGFISAGGVDGDFSQEMWDSLLAMEMVHLFALIHDDIIDKSLVRHGVDTPQQYIQKLERDSIHDIEHYGNMQAMLIGDIVYTEAINLFLSCASKKVQTLFVTLLREVIAGEMSDFQLTIASPASRTVIMEKTLLKTARYTVARPFEIGSVLAGASEEFSRHMFEVGEKIGIAFQIQDDLLDIIGKEKNINKKTFTDIREGQQTLITNFIFEHGTDYQKQVLQDGMHRENSEEQKQVLLQMLEESGALKYAQDQVDVYFQSAREALESSMEFSLQVKNNVGSFINLLDKRES